MERTAPRMTATQKNTLANIRNGETTIRSLDGQRRATPGVNQVSRFATLEALASRGHISITSTEPLADGSHLVRVTAL